MIRYRNTLAILILCMLGVGCSNSLQTQLKKELPNYTEDAAIIKPGAAIFIFKMQPKGTWHWYRNSTQQNQLEYAWNASFTLEDRQYDCGFILFKHPFARPDQGNLKKLLDSGQLDLWVKRVSPTVPLGDNRYVSSVQRERVDYTRIESMISSGSLVILLKDKKLVKKFMKLKPDSLTLSSKLPSEPFSRKQVKINYQM